MKWGNKLAINFLKKFIKLESAAGIILFSTAILAIAIDNSPLTHYMESLLALPFTVQLGEYGLSKHLLHWINDGLMVIFFLLVGLEIKRSLLKANSTHLPKLFYLLPQL